MSLDGRKVFVRKNGNQKGGSLYKWSPFDSDKKGRITLNDDKVYFCSTPLGEDGNDFISTYSYNVIYLNNKLIRTAYVQCDYVI